MGEHPQLIYDYYGFPEEAYDIRYPCPGEPALARQVYQALDQAGIPARLDDRRGFDHGLFVALKLMYPEADIPCVQLSLVNSLDAGAHLAIGRALRALDYDNLLVIGSGFSFHNMRAFFAANTPEIRARNQAFEDWLEQTCTDITMHESERAERLVQWDRAPHARFFHPREEHLLPDAPEPCSRYGQIHYCHGVDAGGTGLSAAQGLFEIVWSPQQVRYEESGPPNPVDSRARFRTHQQCAGLL
ncbi:DODA-type extradiol aromatic ring-opening family dioxygenase [Marinobacter salinus]|uniref:DODA-type extradiol aromatic ring-opening family dioxygenase n=1 Tax=Marinobacter salinus TaxID=1874317 RepID=UPI0018E070D6|nr:class III extradiol ring-cleavage dioxygenase [Marinobacter salinus]